jgi:hypothetical protein
MTMVVTINLGEVDSVVAEWMAITGEVEEAMIVGMEVCRSGGGFFLEICSSGVEF